MKLRLKWLNTLNFYLFPQTTAHEVLAKDNFFWDVTPWCPMEFSKKHTVFDPEY
jgi:hypothetical protein